METYLSMKDEEEAGKEEEEDGGGGGGGNTPGKLPSRRLECNPESEKKEKEVGNKSQESGRMAIERKKRQRREQVGHAQNTKKFPERRMEEQSEREAKKDVGEKWNPEDLD